LLAEHFDKVDPQRDGVDVHEQEVAAELPFQPIMHSASVARAIVAAITDEDLGRHHQIPGGPVQILYHQMGLTLHDSSQAPCELLHVHPIECLKTWVPPAPPPRFQKKVEPLPAAYSPQAAEMEKNG